MPLNHTLHTATLIDDRLYILNGIEIETQFFYLDVSVTFNTKSIGWTDLSSTNIIPPHTGSTSVKGGPKNNTLFLFGGISWDNMNVLYTFDPRNNSWSTPKTTGVDIITKYGTTGVVDYNGKMYIFDGHGIPFEPSEMLILDTINLSWSRGSLVNAASPRRFYGATLLPNQHIIYLGGFDFDGEKNLPLNEVYLYDTINDSWSTKTTSGAIPSERASFSTVLGLDGQRIIIFGGAYSDPEGLGGVSLIEPRNALCELDLINYEWSIPKTKGQTPNYRAFHEATVIGKYMVISFGIGFGKEEDILLLDISNNTEYVWTDTFVPTLPKPSTPPAQTSKNNGHVGHVIIGAVVGSLTCIFLLIGGVFLYKGMKPKKRYQPLEEVHEVLIPTSGNQESHEALANPTTPSS